METQITVVEPKVITVGKASIELFPDGLVRITGTRLEFTSTGPMVLKGSKIDLNPGGGPILG